MTGGIGADLVIECAGRRPAIASTVDLVRKKGRICAIGLTGKSDPLSVGQGRVQGLRHHLQPVHQLHELGPDINLIAGALPGRKDHFASPAAGRMEDGFERSKPSAPSRCC